MNIAWRQARTRVMLYLAPSVSAAIGILVIVVYAFTGKGTDLDHKRMGRELAVPVVIAIVIFLHSHFKKYLLSPPLLPSEETMAERQSVRRFWLTSFAIFCAICLMGYLMRRAGVGFLQGL